VTTGGLTAGLSGPGSTPATQPGRWRDKILRLLSMYPGREFVDAGGLIFYGGSVPEMYRRAAVYVDRILKGAKPSDLRVEKPTKFDMVINLKAWKAVGAHEPAVPSTASGRADPVRGETRVERLTIGDVSIVRIEEMVDDTFPAEGFFRPFERGALAPHLSWLALGGRT